MNINDIESKLNEYGVDSNKLLALIFQLQIENKALQNVILGNQSIILNELNQGFDTEAWLNDCTEEAKELHTEFLIRALSQVL